MKRLDFLECFKDVTSGNKKFKTTEYLQEGFIPIIDQGKKFVGGYTDSIKDKFKGTLQCIVYGDHSREVKYIDFDFALGADGVKVLEVDNKLLNPKYAYYYLLTVNLPEAGYDRSYKFLKRIEVPVPDLQTQRQIVAALDKAQSIIDKRQKSIELLDKLLRATFLDMFGDPGTNSKNYPKIRLSESFDDTQYGTNAKASVDRVGLPILRMNNLTYDGFIDLTNLKYIELDDNDELKFELKDRDLLFNRTNSRELVGKTAIWQHGEGYTFAGYLVRIRLKEAIMNPFYLSGVLNSNYGKELLFHKCKLSNNMSNISPTLLGTYEIPKPPISIQNKFESIFNEFQKKKKLFLDSQEKCMILFQSLLQRAFHGDLTLDMDLQLDAFIDNEDLQAIEKDDVLIQLLIDRFERHNLDKVDIEDSNGESENGYQFESLASYEKAKHALFHLLKKEKVVQQYDAENNKTSLSLP
ncbi:restriction endonuclease subunit S [uncultured Algoriphagus sp.]|uniref:restriction endonuclease subunit S n=1 Tax=uncultured Algoriphagus sp. TaxID=417365 RepID=UPI002597447F|nr:restriction endonuclease subunit S [uncultured Algoriphagus sp.]